MMGKIEPMIGLAVLRRLTRLLLRIGRMKSPLSKVPVTPVPDNCDGTLGQDVLRSGGGYVIDFHRMTVEILPAAGTR
jgi:hypothetical protein